jgi:hypothetical protein
MSKSTCWDDERRATSACSWLQLRLNCPNTCSISAPPPQPELPHPSIAQTSNRHATKPATAQAPACAAFFRWQRPPHSRAPCRAMWNRQQRKQITRATEIQSPQHRLSSPEFSTGCVSPRTTRQSKGTQMPSRARLATGKQASELSVSEKQPAPRGWMSGRGNPCTASQ